tara:strand:- start:302 stop:574 length:273 start_codon:yes stop_codon:yes gene_type:complete
MGLVNKMNFKLTKLKIIGSIIIPIIIWILVFVLGGKGTLLVNVPSILRGFLSLHDLGNIFGFGNISLFIIEIIIIYFIWSLIQKKKEVAI